MADEFLCEACGEMCKREPGWDDDKALAELQQNYPGKKQEDCGIVCDDCYYKIRKIVGG